MADKILNTRISLKYDTLANWEASAYNGDDNSKYLKVGEVAFATIPTGEDYINPVTGKNEPVVEVLFKVGDGVSKFNDLKWASAKAADVYNWAKAPTKPNYTASEIGGLEDFIAGEIQDTNDNTTYAFDIVEGKLQVTETAHILGVAQTPVVTTYDFTTPDELEETLKNYKTKQNKVEALENDGTKTVKISQNENGEITVEQVAIAFPTEKDFGILSVSGKDAIKVTEGQNPEVSLALNNAGNVVLSQDDTGLKAEIDLSAYRLIADDEDTKYGIEYDSTNKVIKLTNDITKTEIDATAFIKDGMIDSVELVDKNDKEENGQFLKITWNSDAGKTVTYLDVTTLVDVYTGVDGANIKVTVTSDKKIKADLSGAVKVSLGLANSALQDADIFDLRAASHTHDNKTILDNITSDDISKWNGANGKIAEALEAAKTDASNKDAVVLSEAQKYADGLAGNYATAEQGGKADTALQNITTTENGGLKVTNNNQIDIDDTIVFILDCGDSTN